MVSAMFSCVQRRQERALSLASLAAVGVTPIVVESPCSPPCHQENRRVGVEALSLAAGDDVLLFEDDVRANEHFPRFLGMARERDVPVTFCLLRDRCLSVNARHRVRKARGKLPAQLEAVDVTKWYGTQAVYLPRRVVDRVLADPHTHAMKNGRWDGFDFLVKDVLLDTREPLFVALPNPVQHTAPPSVVPGKPGQAQSFTYHMQPVWKVSDV